MENYKLTDEEKEKLIEATEILLSRDYKSIQNTKINGLYVSVIFSDSLKKYIMNTATLNILRDMFNKMEEGK